MTGSTTTMLDHAGPAPSGGLDGRPGGAKGGKRPLPHIDDITSVTVDLDPHVPMERVLQIAETCLRQAESSKNFGRPDMALKDYIRTNLILLDAIKKNKGWVSLQRDNKTQLERYQRLLRQVHAAHPDFEAIKGQVKADNARTGVQPTVSRPRSSEKGAVSGQRMGNVANGVPRGNGAAPAHPASPPAKNRPPVQPKPQSLQGNALHSAATSNPGDLMQRFAKLRTAQDSHTRTQSLPGNQKPLESSPPSAPIAEMPRIPDAIYNPPRGTISSETAALPTSAPRAMFTRTNSAVSLNTSRNNKPPSAHDATISAQGPAPAGAPAKRPQVAIPAGNSISVQDLLLLMRAGATDVSVLLIDIRNREEFDEGHIMSQATICLEPEVLSRPHISASQIADTMVLAPATEQLLFEKRHEFDVIVFYDQSSEQILDKPQTPEARAVSGLFDALSQYDYSGPQSPDRRPKLLRGGLDGWTSLVGNASLQSSSTTTTKKTRVSAMARSFMNPRQKYATRPIQDPAEAKRWEDTIGGAATVSPIRTTEDFLRRFPSISEHQESMVSPVSPPASRPQSPFEYRLSHEENLYSSLPSPPTRPPPALPRRSYSGLAEAEDSSLALSKKSGALTIETTRKHRMGIKNPNVLCFANSSLQAMFATPGFAQEIWTASWKDVYKVPMKPDEKIENPQLLTKFLEQVFKFLNQGSFKALEAKTIMVSSPRPKP
jgi:ubiquitin carboxyl-terminal hydrolase 8